MPPIVKSLEPGQTLFLDGDISRSFFIVKSGTISIRKTNSDLTSVEISKISQGGIVGEMSFFDGKARSASAIALNHAEVIEILFDDMKKMVEHIPDYLKPIINVMVERLREAHHTILQLHKEIEELKKK